MLPTRRRPSMRRPLALLLLLAGAAGCIDFVEVAAPPPPARDPATVFVSLSLYAAEPGSGRPDSLSIQGEASAGQDTAGARRAFADSRLRVGGQVVPERPGPQGRHHYEEFRRNARASVADGRLTVEPPRVAGLPHAVVALPVPGRAGPDTLSVSAGAGLVLRLRPGAAQGSEAAGWSLVLAAQGGPHMALGGGGPLPDSLVIPADWLPRNAGGTAPAALIQATLVVDSHVASENSADPYLSVGLHTELRWRIRVVPAAP